MPNDIALGNKPLQSPADNHPNRWAIIVAIALALCAAASCLTLVWDSDVFWHLAGGDWMLRHRQVLGIDPFSIDPEPQWVNVHWLFQLTIASLHAIGGFELLSIMKAVLGAAVLLAFALALRRHVSPAWLGLCGLAMIFMLYGRVRVRPEAFTFVYLMLTILLLDDARRGGNAKRLWLLVPIMLLWVNMHGIYVLGLGLIWAAVLGSLADRMLGRGQLSSPLLSGEAIGPMIVATLICLVSPWPIEAAIQPLILWTRVSGENEYYSYAVSELQPTWTVLRLHLDAFAIVGLACLAMLINFRRTPLAHLAWLAAFVLLALLARRNVALMAPAAVFLLALHGQAVITRIAKRLPMLRRCAVPAAAVVVLLTGTAAFGFGTSYIFYKQHAPHQEGLGLQASEFPVELAKFLSDLPADGDILLHNFGDAGAFIYYGSHGRPDPRRLVYMDGRLEAHSLERFISQHRITRELQDSVSAAAVQLPPSVRFIIVRQGETQTLAALSRCERFTLVQVDDVAVCFADRNYAARTPLPKDVLNLSQYDRPLEGSGLVAGGPSVIRTWWKQNPVPMNYRLGQMFLGLGQYDRKRQRPGQSDDLNQRCTLLAIRYLTASLTDGIQPRYISQGTLAAAYHQRAYEEYFAPSPLLPVDVDSARALYLYNQIDLDRLDDADTIQFASQRFAALFLAGQTDVSQQAITQFMQHLPPRVQLNPPPEYFDLRNRISQQMKLSRARAEEKLAGQKLDLAQRVEVLTSPEIGLIDQAISELQNAGKLDQALQLTLGDLLLRKGEVDKALEAYQNSDLYPKLARMTPPIPESLALRLALVGWVRGHLHEAVSSLQSLYDRSKDPAVAYYLGRLLEEIGDYDAARAAVADVHSDDEHLSALLNRLRRRL